MYKVVGWENENLTVEVSMELSILYHLSDEEVHDCGRILINGFCAVFIVLIIILTSAGI